MSQPCAIASCPRVSRALCHCCQQNICLLHLNEHNDLINQQLKPISESLDFLNRRLHTINVSKTIENCRQKLEQWRADSHKRIENFFQQKCEELDRLINEKLDEQQEEIKCLEKSIQQVYERQETTFDDIDYLTQSIDHLKREIKNIEESFVQIQTNPIIVDNHLINIKGLNEPKYDLTILSTIFKIINVPQESYGILAANERVLLIHQAPNLCFVDKDLSIMKKIPWRHGIIYDACWSSILGQFIILHEKHLFFLDEITSSITQIRPPEKRKWFSCTCSDRYLFLSTNKWGSSISKIQLLLNKKIGQQYESPPLCKEDEYIDSIAYENKSLAMIIRNRTYQTLRIDLASSESLKLLWSFTLDIPWNRDRPFQCCSFLNGDWLVGDFERGSLLHVAKEGKLKSTAPCNAIPQCMTLFGPNRLAISTKDGIYFYELNFEKKFTILVV